MHLNFLHPFGFICRFPRVGLSTTSCVYVVSVSMSEFLLHPCASQQLPACIWFQHLGFLCLSTTSFCAHLVSISNFPPMCLSSNFPNFLHSLGFNIYALQGVQRPSPCDTSALFFLISTFHTSFGLSVRLNLVPTCVKVPHLGAFTWFQYLNFPAWYLSQQFPAFIHLVSTLPLWPLNNFLHASQLGFNVQASPLVSQQLLALIWFQYLTSPLCLSSHFLNFLHSLGFNIYTSPVASPQLLAFILFFLSKLPPRCPSTTSCIPSATSCIHLVLYLAPPWPPKVPPTCASQPLPAFMRFQYLSFPPSSLHSFLHAPSFGFNI